MTDAALAVTAKIGPADIKKSSKRRESVKKWGRPAIEAGFAIVPIVLIQKQNELGLDPIDFNIIFQLISHWWKADKRPFPSKSIIAERIGVDPSTVRRHVAKMEEKELIKRVRRADRKHGQRSNYYDLKPLADKLHPLAVKALKERKATASTR